MSLEIVRADAAARLGIDATTLDVTCHEQIFPSTTCGFPGIGGAAMTQATVVVADAKAQGACVYVAGRLCYLVREPNEDFYADLSAKKLSAASRYKGQYDQVPLPPEETFVLEGSKKPPMTFAKALDAAYIRSHPFSGSKIGPKPATVLRASDGVVMCRAALHEDGALSPIFDFTPEAAEYQFDGRFPRLGSVLSPEDIQRLGTNADPELDL